MMQTNLSIPGLNGFVGGSLSDINIVSSDILADRTYRSAFACLLPPPPLGNKENAPIPIDFGRLKRIVFYPHCVSKKMLSEKLQISSLYPLSSLGISVLFILEIV